MQSLQNLIGEYPSRMDSVTPTLVGVTIAVFTTVFIIMLVRFHSKNSSYGYRREARPTTYIAAAFIAVLVSFNVGTVGFLADQNKVGSAYKETVEATVSENIQKNFDVENIELHDSSFYGDYYTVDAIMSTSDDTYHLSFMYYDEVGAMVPEPNSVSVDELPFKSDSELTAFMEDYDDFAGKYLQIMYSIKDSSNNQFFVGSVAALVTSIILTVLVSGIAVLCWFMNLSSERILVTLAAFAVNLAVLFFTALSVSDGHSGHMRNAQIQNIEHNYDVLTVGDTEKNGDSLKADVMFKGVTSTHNMSFEYSEPLGHMLVADDDGNVAALRPGSPLESILLGAE